MNLSALIYIVIINVWGLTLDTLQKRGEGILIAPLIGDAVP